MEKVLSLIIIGLLCFSTFTVFALHAEAQEETIISFSISSDTTTEWWNGTAWNPSVACWVSPSWPSIEGAL
jgi:hypothetical protein